MPIERLGWLVAAAAIVIAVLLAAAPIPQGWDKAAHFVAFSALTVCLWLATGSTRPRLVVAGVAALAALDEWRQAYVPGRMPDATDFLVDLCAVAATAALLLTQRKFLCAESSPR